MAKNRIELGQIEKRFGRPGGSSGRPDNPRPGDASSSGNTLFAFLFIVILIVGTGALVASKRRRFQAGRLG